MILPVRCFTCGKVFGQSYYRYRDLVEKQGYTEPDAMDAVGLKRYCCRRIFLTHVELIDEMIKY
jgi:DNA-directed RNA polymerase I, II, and III subunit RPABC5